MQIKVVPRLSKRPYLFKDAFIFLGGKYFMKVKCLDGKELEGNRVALVDDGHTHRITIRFN